MKSLFLAGAALAAATLVQPAFADPISVVAAEISMATLLNRLAATMSQ